MMLNYILDLLSRNVMTMKALQTYRSTLSFSKTFTTSSKAGSLSACEYVVNE